MTAQERAASLDRVAEEDEPPGLEEWSGPDDELTAADLAELREAAEADARAAAFGAGMALDVMPASAFLSLHS